MNDKNCINYSILHENNEKNVLDIKNFIKQANQLSRGIWKQYSILDARILALGISQVNKNDIYFKDTDIDIHSIFNTQTKLGFTHYQMLFKALEKLSSRTIHINDKYTFKIIPIFEYISISPLDKKITIKFNEQMKDYILNLHTNFTLYQIEQLLKLQSIYSQKIFTFLKSFSNCRNKNVRIDIKDLYTQLDCEDKYKDFRNFESKVLNTAYEEINEKTDLKFEYVKIKNWRSITAIIFKITKSEFPQQDDKNITPLFIFKELSKYNMNKKQAYILVNSIDPNILYSKITNLKTKYEQETLNIPFAAWLWGCLRNEHAVLEQSGKVADDHIQNF